MTPQADPHPDSQLWRPRGEDGRISVFLAITLTAVIVIVGLSVDGGARLRATQRADNLAAEAARAAGQAIDAPQAIAGGAKVIDPPRAAAAAQAYLESADSGGDLDGYARLSADRRRVEVTVTITRNTVMLTFLGYDEITVTGHATAVLVTG
jgi:hypothetical protein